MGKVYKSNLILIHILETEYDLLLSKDNLVQISYEYDRFDNAKIAHGYIFRMKSIIDIKYKYQTSIFANTF